MWQSLAIWTNRYELRRKHPVGDRGQRRGIEAHRDPYLSRHLGPLAGLWAGQSRVRRSRIQSFAEVENSQTVTAKGLPEPRLRWQDVQREQSLEMV
jgi:hypothetical protein